MMETLARNGLNILRQNVFLFTFYYLRKCCEGFFLLIIITQLTFICSKSIIKALEKGVKYVQS